ncbi:MAG: MreB/Mrl family cell shape determining protein [Dehalococcoidia bacterium]|nr:MreB/Mrl family cell shape determining protein [Dehalococcoidia bacterium]
MFSHDIGIDLGTANTLVSVRGRGIVIDEPSVVAIDKVTKRILAIGAEAKRMVGRTPSTIVAVRPLRDGVISDFAVTEKMLQHFIRSVHEQFGLGIPKPRVVVGIPSGATEVEKRAVHDAALAAGARSAFLIEEPMAAAIGAGLPVMNASGSMIVDIGGGTTEVAVLALGGIVRSMSVRAAGDAMDQAIMGYARQVHNMLIGERTAETVKIEAGSAYPLDEDWLIDLRGRDLATGLPKAVEVSTVELRDALSPVTNDIVRAVRANIETTPPELVADLMLHGIAMTGGGALLRGLDRRVATETRFPVYVTPDPLRTVVRGCAEALEEAETLQKVQSAVASRRPPR